MSVIFAFPLALVACGAGGGGNVPAPAPGNASEAANAETANLGGPAPAAGMTREFLVGSWATDSCEVPSVIYAADGTTDGGRRRWTLEEDRLIVTGGAAREQSVVERLGNDRLRLNTGAGPFELHRCPAARP